MFAIAEILNPALARVPAAARPPEMILTHLANPKRRGFIRQIGYDEVLESYLRASYGISWPDVQADVRALVTAGIVLIDGFGAQATYSLNLSVFPRQLAAGLFENTGVRQVA